MQIINLHCPREGLNGGLIPVPRDDVLPYEPNGDETAMYGFDCMRCRTTHQNLHASIGIANALRVNGVPTRTAWERGVERLLQKLTREEQPIDEFDVMIFMERFAEREQMLALLDQEDPS